MPVMSVQSVSDVPTFVHDHSHILTAANDFPYTLLVVNGAIGSYLPALWASASVRVAVDGGLNAVDRYCPASLVPSLIIGDFDSVSAGVLNKYKRRGALVVFDDDGYTTDLEKAINYMSDSNNALVSSSTSLPSASPHPSRIIIYGAFGGRFDQQIANVKAIYAATGKVHDIFLIGEGNLVRVLLPGHHTITCHPQYEAAGKHCGYYPLFGTAHSVSTSGTRWDITDRIIDMNGLLGTNNLIASDTITIRTSDTLVFSTEFGEEDNATSGRCHQQHAASNTHHSNGSNNISHSNDTNSHDHDRMS